MKTYQLLPALVLALALNVVAQEQPPAIRIILAQPAPDEPIPVPMGAWKGEFGFEPGFAPGDMLMPDMPGRFDVVSAQIQQNGKAVPIVLKVDTQTGQVWQLQFVMTTEFVNGRKRVNSKLTFVPVDAHQHPQPLPHAEPDFPGDSIEGGEATLQNLPRTAPAPPERLSNDG